MDPVARSSSPVSGCFLKRLEIMDKATAHSYEAAPGSILTLSLESYAAGLSQSSSLMLHLHRNGRSMLQVNMSNILKTHQDNGIIQIVESLQQLRVTIPSTGEVTAHFVERRDFSMATCILEKAGFLIHEVLRVMQHKPSTSFQQSATDFGPRLSDIRPPGSRQRIPHSSSLAMQQLGEESAPDSLLETQTTPESTWDYSTPSQSASLVSHLDPYVHFLGKQANMHQPQVSSPLRNSFEAEPSLVPDMPVETPPSSYPEEATPREESFGSATSRPVRVLTQKSGRTRPPLLKPDPPSRIPSCEDSDSSQRSDEFRGLMPPPRNLPFMKHPKRPQVESIPVLPKGQTKTQTDKGLKRPVIYKDRGTSCYISGSGGHGRGERSPTSTYSAGEPAKHPIRRSTVSATILEEPAQHAWPPDVIVTDSSDLQVINETTSGLLDQYLADVERGCDPATCAQFYLSQIHNARRYFWYSKIARGPGSHPTQ